MYYLGYCYAILNGNSINRRRVLQPCNNLIQIHDAATIFIERNENKGACLSVDCCVFTVLCGLLMMSEQVFAYYLFDSHERFACPKAPHTSYISTSFYKRKTTKQHGSL